ncbi:MAG: hypothetical protein RIK87_05805 [Fuerstiella sp.]
MSEPTDDGPPSTPMLSHDHDWHWAERLELLGLSIQQYVYNLLCHETSDLATPVAEEGGDTIYAIDRHVEPLIEQSVAAWPDECRPLLLVAEGMGPDGRQRFGAPGQSTRYRVLIDPIDGTRGLMYDKRSAWFLAAVAFDRGEATGLRDVFASVMVELPTSKQGLCDAFAAVRGLPTRCKRTRVGGAEFRLRSVAPSTSATLAGGFAHVTSFFQGTRLLAADLMESIVQAVVPTGTTSRSAVLDDQYISTGGQMVELITGHDRFCCDLRPLFHQILSGKGPLTFPELTCHPYDAAGLLVAEQSGVIITDGFGNPLNAGFNVDDSVHWCGYANSALQSIIQPVIQGWLARHGIEPH